MKGTLVGTWVKTLKKQYPHEVIREKMELAGIDPDKSISPEAARAGDAGDGFAVVAEEVRKLANQSDSAAGKIKTDIAHFLEDIDHIEGLAAIATENSASTEEVSASVSSYSEEIKKLSSGIGDFNQLTDEFSNYLSEYKV